MWTRWRRNANGCIGEGRPPALLYTVPTFHNPTGVTATAERRAAVLALSRQYGIPHRGG